MVAWTDYRKDAQERGSLALELFAVLTEPTGSPENVKRLLPDHLAYQALQEQRGTLAFAGPLSDDTGEQMLGTGLIVYRADSLEAARALADADPMHAGGARAYRIRRWLINEGSLQLDVRLSAQSVRL